MKHSPTGMSVPPPASEIFLLHLINFGLFLNLLKKHFDITLIDTPASYSASTSVLLTLVLYSIAVSEFTSSMVMFFMNLSSQSESKLVSMSCIALMSCSACFIGYVDSLDLLESATSLIEMLLFLAFFRILSLHFLAMSAILKLYFSLSFLNISHSLIQCLSLQ